MKRLTLPLLAVLALCGFKPAVPPRADTGPVTLSLVERDQRLELPAYLHRGQYWVAGRQGQPYAVRLRNNSPERVLVVLSVDGLNVITGEVAAPDQTGYVLDPWQSADITGWRKSRREVAQFVFTDPGNSYADRTGRPDNIGVIGIAVFNEAPRYVPLPPRTTGGARAEQGTAAGSSRSGRPRAVIGGDHRFADPCALPGTRAGHRPWRARSVVLGQHHLRARQPVAGPAPGPALRQRAQPGGARHPSGALPARRASTSGVPGGLRA